MICYGISKIKENIFEIVLHVPELKEWVQKLKLRINSLYFYSSQLTGAEVMATDLRVCKFGLRWIDW